MNIFIVYVTMTVFKSDEATSLLTD